MKTKKLMDLIRKVEDSTDLEQRDFISLNEEMASKIYGGQRADNSGCNNSGCTAGSNSGCTNSGCTTGTSNSGCTNVAKEVDVEP